MRRDKPVQPGQLQGSRGREGPLRAIRAGLERAEGEAHPEIPDFDGRRLCRIALPVDDTEIGEAPVARNVRQQRQFRSDLHHIRVGRIHAHLFHATVLRRVANEQVDLCLFGL